MRLNRAHLFRPAWLRSCLPQASKDRTLVDLADQARISDVIQDSDFRTESHCGKNRIFPPSLGTSGARREPSQLRTVFTSVTPILNLLKHLGHTPRKLQPMQFHLDCSSEAKSRFATFIKHLFQNQGRRPLGGPFRGADQWQDRSADSSAPGNQARPSARNFDNP
jgi:hypothetical protein